MEVVVELRVIGVLFVPTDEDIDVDNVLLFEYEDDTVTFVVEEEEVRGIAVDFTERRAFQLFRVEAFNCAEVIPSKAFMSSEALSKIFVSFESTLI
jgi:hypothetical protein